LLAAANAAIAGAAYVPGAFDGGVPASVPVVSMQEQRFTATVRQKFDFSCGSAALATLLTYQYGAPVSEDKVLQEMLLHGDEAKIRREGFSLLDMKKYLDAHGYQADGYQVPLDKLVQAGVPAIVLISENGYKHFVVIKGVAMDRVLIGDPSRGTRAVARGGFEQLWTNRILFVIHNRSQQARFNTTTDWKSAPLGPVALGLVRDGLGTVVIPKFGPGGF